MKHARFAIIAIALSVPAAAQAATTDPEVIIYRFPGVRDDGSGVVTVFHCTNFSGATETLRFVTRRNDGFLLQNDTATIPHLATVTASTQNAIAYSETLILASGVVAQGTTAIAATSTSIICTAMTIDATITKVVGVALRGVRFSPAPGSQE